MPRQRSKKLTASRKTAEKPLPDPVSDDSQSESEHESLEISDQDEEEEDLARLVLGDGATFKDQLAQDMDIDGGENSDDHETSGEAEEGEEGLEGIDDADVRITPPS